MNHKIQQIYINEQKQNKHKNKSPKHSKISKNCESSEQKNQIQQLQKKIRNRQEINEHRKITHTKTYQKYKTQINHTIQNR